MPHTLPNDGLLKAAKFLSGFLQALLGLVAICLLVAVPVVLLSQKHVAEAMVADTSAGTGTVIGAIALTLLLGAVIMGSAFIFLRLLRQIINSVGEGDPFILENSERLRKMGWVVVLIEVLKFPVSALGNFLTAQLEPDTFTLDVNFSLTGMLIALVLFILARVFRHGAAMRADLEGTV